MDFNVSVGCCVDISDVVRFVDVLNGVNFVGVDVDVDDVDVDVDDVDVDDVDC
jgi:hypothetical protein